MHNKYAFQKCKSHARQVSTTYANIHISKQVQKEQQHNKAKHTTNTQQANSKTASIFIINSKHVLSSESTTHSSNVQQMCA
jgi:hypothetical protein